jgi:hypothetical protein
MGTTAQTLEKLPVAGQVLAASTPVTVANP